MKYSLVCQEWDESEAGWGVRPDGYSFHLSEEDCVFYIREYWTRMPKEVPSEYSRPCGKPLWVAVTSSFFEKVKNIVDGGAKGYRVGHSSGKIMVSKTGERLWEEKE